MSDFDKEAEREKLRKKYEQEEEQREATEQMSELLLKGATMTNAHCSECGDPIFRYDGQEFCPTCQRPVDRGTDEQAESAADDAAGEEGSNGTGNDERIEVTTPSNDASVQFGGADADAESTSADESHAETADRPAEPGGPATRDPTGSDGVRQVPSAAPQGTTSEREPGGHEGGASTTTTESTEGTTGSAGDHLRRAQAVLARTVERYARRAAETDDPREARAHLETAREAAETLDATGF